MQFCDKKFEAVPSLVKLSVTVKNEEGARALYWHGWTLAGALETAWLGWEKKEKWE